MPSTDERRKNKRKKIKRIVTIIFITVFIFASALITFGKSLGFPSWNEIFDFCMVSADLGDGISLSFIDVGSADACYVKCGDKNLLIDSGTSLSYNKLSAYLKRNDCTHFDAIIASHTDSDHIGSIADIIRDFGADKLYMKCFDGASEVKKEDLIRLNNSVKEYKTVVISPEIPSEINIGDMHLKFISPDKDYNKSNDNSLVVRITYKNKSFLFTGDISEKVEKELINSNLELNSDVLKVAHHGSKSSTSEDFLKAVSPEISVVSAGSDDIYLPYYSKMALINAYSKELYCTNKDKTIVVTYDGSTLKVKTHA